MDLSEQTWMLTRCSCYGCIKVLVMVIGVSLSQAPALAVDIITKKSDGKKLSGSISAMSKNELTLKRPQGEESVPANDIALIEWEGGGGELKIGYSYENSGRYEPAVERILKAKNDAKSPNKFLQGEFEYVLARLATRLAIADPGKRDQAIQKLITAQKSYPDHIRYYESALLLAQIQLAAKDFDGARKAVDLLKSASSGDLLLAAQIAEARVLAGEGKIDEAIAGFEAAAKSAGDSPTGSQRKSEALLGQARGLITRSKFEDALKILKSITEKNGPVDDTAIDAEAFVLQGDALRGIGHNKEAILAYLYVDLICSRETEFHAESLYQLTSLWKLDQHPDRSTEAAGKLVQLYPNSEWRKKLSGIE